MKISACISSLEKQGSSESFYSYNGHGDVVQLTNSSGSVTKQYSYDAFGVEIDKDDTDTNPFRYCGEYYDKETDSIYLRARYYAPAMGRFITEDPILDGLNWYSYCGGNPVNAWDPWGLWLDGDELLSQAAQEYTTFYGEKWEEAKKQYDECIAKGDVLGAENAQNAMNLYHEKADDIRRLDAEGEVQGITLDVPKYNQMNTPPMDNSNNLCWATSTAMIASFQLGDTIDRTLTIAITITGSTTVSGYNQPWSWISTADPSLGLGIATGQTQKEEVLTMAQIQTAIDGNNPFGVLYRDDISGHWVVGVGYAISPGHDPIVVSNNPWGGIQRICTYNEFKNCGPDDPRPWAWTAQ